VARALRVASSFPDPPFDASTDPPSGLDVELMQAVAGRLGRRYELHRYEGADFEGIYAGLAAGDVDVVTSGATVTEHRSTLARFCAPYLHSGQSLVVDAHRNPKVRTTDDLDNGVVGVQRGNTSEPVVEQLRAQGRIRAVHVYAYDAILTALDDVAAGTITAFMKLEPVLRHLTRDRPGLRIVQTGITHELIASAVRTGDATLADEIDRTQRALAADGTLAALGRRWLVGSDPAATGMMT